MKSRLSGASLALVMLLSLVTIPASFAATPKAGQKCSKLGATQTYSGKKFTCVKSGSKLTWNKGVAISKATSPSPSAPVKFASSSEAEQNLGCNFEAEEAFSLSGPLVCKKERWVLVQKTDGTSSLKAISQLISTLIKLPDRGLTRLKVG